jgi:hypothetical protein
MYGTLEGKFMWVILVQYENWKDIWQEILVIPDNDLAVCLEIFVSRCKVHIGAPGPLFETLLWTKVGHTYGEIG